MEPAGKAQLTEQDYKKLYKENRNTPIGKLPLDVFKIILNQLAPADLLTARSVCTYFRDSAEFRQTALVQAAAMSALELKTKDVREFSEELLFDLLKLNERLKFHDCFTVTETPPVITYKRDHAKLKQQIPVILSDIQALKIKYESTKIPKELERIESRLTLLNELINYTAYIDRLKDRDIFNFVMPFILPKNGYLKLNSGDTYWHEGFAAHRKHEKSGYNHSDKLNMTDEIKDKKKLERLTSFKFIIDGEW